MADTHLFWIHLNEASHRIAVIPRAEIIQPGFRIPLFAGELVVIAVICRADFQLTTPGIII
jgi:hypothetical protein